MDNRLPKFFFQILSHENAEVVNLKNPDLDLIRSILLECGYFGFMIRFWISPKKRKIRFWIQESVFGFSQKKKTHPQCAKIVTLLTNTKR